MNITIDRREHKQEARLAMREQRPKVFLVALVFFAILYVLDILSVKLDYPGMKLLDIFTAVFDEESAAKALVAADRRNFISKLLTMAVSVITAIITLGFIGFSLNVSRRQSADFGDLFDPFSIPLKVVFLNIVMGLLIAMWAVLLLIPGIIAAYRYSMATFILLDDPDKDVLVCLRESRLMTQGHKWELFVLDLSFLGWFLLSIVPFVKCYTIPYYFVTKAKFYQSLCEKPIVTDSETPPDNSVN